MQVDKVESEEREKVEEGEGEREQSLRQSASSRLHTGGTHKEV